MRINLLKPINKLSKKMFSRVLLASSVVLLGVFFFKICIRNLCFRSKVRRFFLERLGFSLSNPASIGGTRQRNIMTFDHIYLLLWGYILHFFLEGLILFFYFIFEKHMSENLIFVILCIFWTCSYTSSTILVPLFILVKSRQSYLEIWYFSPHMMYKFKEIRSHNINTSR